MYASGRVTEWYGPLEDVIIKICELKEDSCVGNYATRTVKVDPDTLDFSLLVEPYAIIYQKGSYKVEAHYWNNSGDKHQQAINILEVTEEFAPLKSVLMENIRIVDQKDNDLILDEIRVSDKIAFASDLTPNQDRSETPVLIVQVQDDNGVTVFMKWNEQIELNYHIDRNIAPDWESGPAPEGAFIPITQTAQIDWEPEIPGKYVATFILWESRDNPTSLAPSQIIEFEVLPSLDSVCGEGTVYKEGQCLPVCGEGTVFKDGKCVIEKTASDTQQSQVISVEQSDQGTKDGGGCLIATATYGSELAPQVQFLREIRDNTVLSTASGTSFMTAFNAFYYSFSPTVADLERQNPMFKEIVQVAITPLLSSLSLLQYVDIDSESEMLGYGIGIILLNIGMYFVAPMSVILKLHSKLRNLN